MKKAILLYLICCLTGMAYAQKNLPLAKKRAVYGSGFYVSPCEYDYSKVAQTVVQGCDSKYSKAESLFQWICDKISYDTKTDIRTADKCWEQQKAVCQGYCELYFRMAECVGLKTKLIYGKSRNSIGQSEEHAWLSVETEKGNILLDPTWGAGSVENGKFCRQPNCMVWFDVEPEWFVFTHFPKDKKNMMMNVEISEAQFMKLPYASQLTAKLGFDGKEALEKALNGKLDFPLINAASSRFLNMVTLKKVPIQRHLKVGSSYTFTVEKKSDDYALSINNAREMLDETKWSKTDNVYTITVVPQKKGRLHIVLTSNKGFVKMKHGIVEYEVK